MSSEARRFAAFTLIELMITVALIGSRMKSSVIWGV